MKSAIKKNKARIVVIACVVIIFLFPSIFANFFVVTPIKSLFQLYHSYNMAFTNALVTSSQVVPTSDSCDGLRIKVSYAYTVNKALYTSSNYAFNNCWPIGSETKHELALSFKPHQNIKIYYDKMHPEFSVVERNILQNILFILLPISIFIIALRIFLRNADEIEQEATPQFINVQKTSLVMQKATMRFLSAPPDVSNKSLDSLATQNNLGALISFLLFIFLISLMYMVSSKSYDSPAFLISTLIFLSCLTYFIWLILKPKFLISLDKDTIYPGDIVKAKVSIRAQKSLVKSFKIKCTVREFNQFSQYHILYDELVYENKAVVNFEEDSFEIKIPTNVYPSLYAKNKEDGLIAIQWVLLLESPLFNFYTLRCAYWFIVSPLGEKVEHEDKSVNF